MPVVVDGKSGSYRRTFDNQGFLEVDSAQRHDPTSAKIIFWGDSTTFGYGVSVESTFVELIDHDFPAFDAINLGVVG